MKLHLGFERGTIKPYVIDSSDLLTHAMCVGMTGSGKTGLCIGLLEEVAFRGVPLIAIDPKGDLANMMLALTEPIEYRHFSDESMAKRAKMTLDEYAIDQCARWDAGRRTDGVDGEKLRVYREDLNFRLYAPGGGPGRQLSIASALRCPPQARGGGGVFSHAAIVADSIVAMVKNKPSARESALVATILTRAWQDGQDMDFALLVDAIQNPPMALMGAQDTDTFFPRKARMKFAQEINALIASPSWHSWVTGDDLDAGQLFFEGDASKSEGPVVNIVSIAHLPENMRHFFVGLLLNQVATWMRTQNGSHTLRALVYMDEVAGYFPPTRNTPAKAPAMLLMKQARAFGIGCVFATQNPVDIDYKLMSNMGMWMIGKLTTERDHKRLMAGLKSTDMTGAELIGPAIAGLDKREFLMHNIHRGHPHVIRSRHTMSWLCGPLSALHMSQLAGLDEGENELLALQAKLNALDTAIREQARVLEELQDEVKRSAGHGFIQLILMALMGGRFGKMQAMRGVSKVASKKKVHALQEAQARMMALVAEREETVGALSTWTALPPVSAEYGIKKGEEQCAQ